MNQRLSDKEIRERCEVCQNLDSVTFHNERIIGERITHVHRNENGCVDFERCDIHSSEIEDSILDDNPEDGWERLGI